MLIQSLGRAAALIAFLSPLALARSLASGGEPVREEQKISATAGGFAGTLANGDGFGGALALLGDLGGDGRPEVAVGAPFDDQDSLDAGALWLVSLSDDGTVQGQRKITQGVSGFTGALDPDDRFGRSLAALGDLDNDGVGDLAVGAPRDDDGGINRGALWILFLNANGTVKAQQKISFSTGGFSDPTLFPEEDFAMALCAMGDLNGDGVEDLAVGAPKHANASPSQRGGLWILFLNTNGTVKAQQKISSGIGGFSGSLMPGDRFASALAALGDVDGDGVRDLAVGAEGDDAGATDRGALWVLNLKTDGTVKAWREINAVTGGLVGPIGASGGFGRALAAPGDLDGNGVPDVAVGSLGTNTRGEVWLLCLNSASGVVAEQRFADGAGGFGGLLDNGDRFGAALAPLGDLDGLGAVDLACGADGDDDGGTDRGAVWALLRGDIADCDGDGIPDHLEPDCDGDGLPDDCELGDCDNDGIPDDCEPDCDNDGTPDDCEPDCDNDGTPDDCEPDCDNDGLPDDCEPDCDFDGTPDDCEPDCDNDGIPDDCELDTDGDGIPDDCEEDCDGDGIPDELEPDCDNDGTPDDCERDCDDDGVPDDCELDCDNDGLPDDCEPDCDNDTIPDDCEPDCDNDGTPDDCEPDCDNDTIPDDCEPDCDNDGVPDDCEPDCDFDGLPDDCEPDCDNDGLPDDCEADCDFDGLPDDCEADCDDDGIPDDCEVGDCDNDGIPDDCEPDTNGNGIPDDCDPPAGVTLRNGTGVNDECFSTLQAPKLGQTWTASLDVSDEPLPFFTFVLITDTPALFATGYGELLVTGTVLLFNGAPITGGVGTHVIPFASLPSLVGVTVYAQGVVTRAGGPKLCNALDLLLGF